MPSSHVQPSRFMTGRTSRRDDARGRDGVDVLCVDRRRETETDQQCGGQTESLLHGKVLEKIGVTVQVCERFDVATVRDSPSGEIEVGNRRRCGTRKRIPGERHRLRFALVS